MKDARTGLTENETIVLEFPSRIICELIANMLAPRSVSTYRKSIEKACNSQDYTVAYLDPIYLFGAMPTFLSKKNDNSPSKKFGYENRIIYGSDDNMSPRSPNGRR